MLFLFFPLLVKGLAEVLSESNNFESKSMLLSEGNTVIFVQTKILERIGDHLNPTEDGMINTTLNVYQDEISNKKLVYSDTKSSGENTFFFTTTKRGNYYLVVYPATGDKSLKQSLSVDIKIFTGEANRHQIVSTNDVEVSRAEGMVQKILDFVEKNIAVQSLNDEDEKLYKQLYSSLTSKIFYFIILRFVSIIFTMMWSNYMTKNFYSSQGILMPK